MYHMGLYHLHHYRESTENADEAFDAIVAKYLTPAQAVSPCDAGNSDKITDSSTQLKSPEDNSVTSLAGQLADTNVTPPDSGTSTPLGDGDTASTGPSVIVVDAPDLASQASGRSPKRKASDSEDKLEEEPAFKVERRGDIEQLIKHLNEHRKTPVPEDLVEAYRSLPGEAVDELREELFFRDLSKKEKRRRDRVHRYQDEYEALYESRRARHMPMPPRIMRNPDSSSDEEDFSGNQQHNSEPIPDGKFTISQEQRLLRLLIMGGEKRKSATATGRNRSNDVINNFEFHLIPDMIEQGQGVRVVEILRDVSEKGRSPKQDGLLYGLAMCCRSKDMETKAKAYGSLQAMCRTPTQIFQVIKYIENLDKNSTGWGRGLRRALTQWYNNYADNPMRLAMHVTKYWTRHDWSHRDVFRLTHLKPVNDVIGFIIRYCVKDMDEAEKYYLEDGYVGRDQLEKVHKYLKAVEEAKHTEDASRAVELIREHRLVREHLKTELLNSALVWQAMLKDMPLMALIRNLNKMTNIGLFDDPENLKLVISKLSNVEVVKKARIHPIKLLIAHHTYLRGRGDLGSMTWTPNPEIVATLEKAFYDCFKNVEPTNKRILIALDISGSMTTYMADLNLTAREVATVMAMITTRVETNCDIVGFHTKLIDLNILFKNSNKTLNKQIECTSRLTFGNTDCSKPMLWALKRRKEYDAFIIYTDCETNCHRMTPAMALQKYRQEMNIPEAKLVVCGITSSDFSIAHPNDTHMLDVVGFDPDTPDAISAFVSGDLEK